MGFLISESYFFCIAICYSSQSGSVFAFLRDVGLFAPPLSILELRIWSTQTIYMWNIVVYKLIKLLELFDWFCLYYLALIFHKEPKLYTIYLGYKIYLVWVQVNCLNKNWI